MVTSAWRMHIWRIKSQSYVLDMLYSPATCTNSQIQSIQSDWSHYNNNDTCYVDPLPLLSLQAPPLTSKRTDLIQWDIFFFAVPTMTELVPTASSRKQSPKGWKQHGFVWARYTECNILYLNVLLVDHVPSFPFHLIPFASPSLLPSFSSFPLSSPLPFTPPSSSPYPYPRILAEMCLP